VVVSPYIPTLLNILQQYYAPYFETVIRYLGGLLSAYALTDNPMLLKKADELALKLDPVFETKSGFPWFGVNPST
jgi:endoplasmic reticulum Man9GlcNAc2 1,2-alpha-mannosidase